MSRRLTDLSFAELTNLIAELGQPKWRAGQIYEWIYKRGTLDTNAMGNLPAVLRDALSEKLSIPPIQVESHQKSRDGTQKFLARLSDGLAVECVIIPAGNRTTVCLSSQVGCAVRCVFCASGMDGGKRNLTRGEIIEQFLIARRLSLDEGRPLTNLVMMGMGEPMFNLTAVLSALSAIHDPNGCDFGARRITVSTVGIAEGVKRFTAAKTAYTLAFSLHAPNDELREQIVPLKNAMSVTEIVTASRDYLATTGREATFEYVLLRGVNDQKQHADELARVLRRARGTVNLIPHNPVSGLEFSAPHNRDVESFEERLISAGIKVTVRRQKGEDIDAACGQLARRQ